jgi:hypothetical protein
MAPEPGGRAQPMPSAAASPLGASDWHQGIARRQRSGLRATQMHGPCRRDCPHAPREVCGITPCSIAMGLAHL